MDELLLGAAETSLVRDVEDAIVGLSVLTVNASDLNVVSVSDLVKLVLVCHQLWQFDVHRGSHGSTQIGWARGDVTEVIIMSELQDFLNMSSSSAKSVENFSNTSTFLHGNNSELILLVDPDKESFCVIVEDTSARWPVSVQVTGSKELVTLLEKEMIIDELLLVLLAHSFERIEFSLEITFKTLESFDALIHNFESLLLGNTWAKWESLKVSTNSDSCRENHSGILRSKFTILKAD